MRPLPSVGYNVCERRHLHALHKATVDLGIVVSVANYDTPKRPFAAIRTNDQVRVNDVAVLEDNFGEYAAETCRCAGDWSMSGERSVMSKTEL